MNKAALLIQDLDNAEDAETYAALVEGRFEDVLERKKGRQTVMDEKAGQEVGAAIPIPRKYGDFFMDFVDAIKRGHISDVVGTLTEVAEIANAQYFAANQ